MRHFPHHIGDYKSHTGHLTFVEDAAYRRLLDLYYQTERPLPADLAAVQRLVGARVDEEKAATEVVLREFFVLADDGWHQARADREITAYQARVETARANGTKSGGRPVIRPIPTDNQVGLPRDTEHKPSVQLTINQIPITNNQPKEARTGARLPDDWTPSVEDLAFAAEQGLPDAYQTAASFRDYWRGVAGAKGRKADWPATWRNWCRKTAESGPRKAPQSFAQQAQAAAATVADTNGEGQWRARMRGYKPGDRWLTGIYGPPPGAPGCQVPPSVLAEWQQQVAA